MHTEAHAHRLTVCIDVCMVDARRHYHPGADGETMIMSATTLAAITPHLGSALDSDYLPDGVVARFTARGDELCVELDGALDLFADVDDDGVLNAVSDLTDIDAADLIVGRSDEQRIYLRHRLDEMCACGCGEATRRTIRMVPMMHVGTMEALRGDSTGLTERVPCVDGHDADGIDGYVRP